MQNERMETEETVTNEELLSAAERILAEYKEAFEELAK